MMPFIADLWVPQLPVPILSVHSSPSILCPLSKPHLVFLDVKHRQNIGQKRNTKNWHFRVIPIVDADPTPLPRRIALALPKQVLGRKQERLSTERDAELGNLGAALGPIPALMGAIFRWRVEGCVQLLDEDCTR